MLSDLFMPINVNLELFAFNRAISYSRHSQCHLHTILIYNYVHIIKYNNINANQSEKELKCMQ